MLSTFLQRQCVKQNSCPIVAQLGLCSSFPGWSVRAPRSIHTSSREELLIYGYSHKMVRLFKKKLQLLRDLFIEEQRATEIQSRSGDDKQGWLFSCFISLYALPTSKGVEDNRITSCLLSNTKRQEKQLTSSWVE